MLKVHAQGIPAEKRPFSLSCARQGSSQGSKMSKAEYTKLVEQQRVAALQSIRQASSHSLSLSLPATIAETRDFKKDAHDEVLVRLALGMYVCVYMMKYSSGLH